MKNDATVNQTDYETQLVEKDQQIQLQAKEIAALQQQLKWFQRQLFSRQSEKRLIDNPLQGVLAGLFPEPPPPMETPEIEVPAQKKVMPAHRKTAVYVLMNRKCLSRKSTSRYRN